MKNARIKKLAIYATTVTLSLATLTGCDKKDSENTEKLYTTEPPTAEEIFRGNSAIEQLTTDANQGATKIFEPYEHLFYVRVNNIDTAGWSEVVTGGSINIPEGYTVFEIENFITTEKYSSQTAGYDIWYTNTVPVEVNAVYNESLEKYDYSHFGVPIEKEDTIKKAK